MTTPLILTIGALYRCPSGMGGTFDVRLTALDGRVANVRVDCPRNPDWHRYAFKIETAKLYEIPQLEEVRTRVSGDEYFVWGRYADRVKADAAAADAAKYPKCHPIEIVTVAG